MNCTTLLTEISRTFAVVYIKDEFSNTLKKFRLQSKNFKSVSQNRKIHQIISLNSDDLLIRDLSCYYCEDCYISKIQSCGKLEFIGNHRTVKMVETSCEKNDERIDSDGDIIENIVEKGMVVAVLTDDPNYD